MKHSGKQFSEEIRSVPSTDFILAYSLLEQFEKLIMDLLNVLVYMYTQSCYHFTKLVTQFHKLYSTSTLMSSNFNILFWEKRIKFKNPTGIFDHNFKIYLLLFKHPMDEVLTNLFRIYVQLSINITWTLYNN